MKSLLRKNVTRASILLSLTLFTTPIFGALSVSMTPSSDQVVAKDENVSFSCSPSGGCSPYTYSWSFQNGSPASSSSQNPNTVTFGSSAEGKENIATVTVTDSAGATASANIKVRVPKVEVVSADVEQNEIKIKCTPQNLSGTLTIYLKGDVEKQVHTESVSGSTTAATYTFHIESLTTAEKNKTFNKVKGKWTPSSKEATGEKDTSRNFKYLGVWQITNYYTPVEGQFSGSTLSKGTGQLIGTTWINLSDVAHPVAFMNAVDPANEGLGLIGSTVVRFHPTYGNTSATPWTDLQNGNPHYLANPDPDQQTAHCAPFNLIGTSDTIAASSLQLSCGSEVLIQDVTGKKIKRDTGGGLGSEQIDVYIGEGGTSLKQQADDWGNRNKWVIKLL